MATTKLQKVLGTATMAALIPLSRRRRERLVGAIARVMQPA
jgi:hypothetical protein